MRKLLLLISALLVSNGLLAQLRDVKGKVLDSVTSEPIEAAVITNLQTNYKTVSDKNGNFVLRNIKTDSISVSYVGYNAKHAKIEGGKDR